MIKGDFCNEFLRSMEKLPYFEEANPVYIFFSKNFLIIKYLKKDRREIEVLIQPVDSIGGKPLSNLKKTKIYNKNVYLDYDPKHNLFPSHYPPELYTFLKNGDIITVAVSEKKDIKLFKIGTRERLTAEIFKYACKISDEIVGFKKIFLKYSKKIHSGYLEIGFSDSDKKTEINVDVFEDEKEIIDEIINDVIRKKRKLNTQTMTGKVSGRDIIFKRPKKNVLFVFPFNKKSNFSKILIKEIEKL